ncbi:hypothetical protein CHS0354_033971 [Potamilus streckersoni]|uniref:Uncharacterized protein n=1 Tax=Potamilus streckersoni TaxID=2493646 RepID=A0AAE0T8K7_9BIVA|nr:hypothetical protein CHS0354_033971 [Potamilus streckersoni]
MAFNIFLCVMLGLSVQRVVGSCDNVTLNEIKTLQESFHSFNLNNNFTEVYYFICSDKMQQDLVKLASKLEPCLDDIMDYHNPLWRDLSVPYMRRVVKKVSQQYISGVCHTFQDVLPHMECIWNMLVSLQNRSDLLQSLSTCLWNQPAEEPCSIINVVVEVGAHCILDIIDAECPEAQDAAPAFLDDVLKIMPKDCTPRQRTNAVDAVMRSRLIAMVFGILIPAWI